MDKVSAFFLSEYTAKQDCSFTYRTSIQWRGAHRVRPMSIIYLTRFRLRQMLCTELLTDSSIKFTKPLLSSHIEFTADFLFLNRHFSFHNYPPFWPLWFFLSFQDLLLGLLLWQVYLYLKILKSAFSLQFLLYDVHNKKYRSKIESKSTSC